MQYWRIQDEDDSIIRHHGAAYPEGGARQTLTVPLPPKGGPFGLLVFLSVAAVATIEAQKSGASRAPAAPTAARAPAAESAAEETEAVLQDYS